MEIQTLVSMYIEINYYANYNINKFWNTSVNDLNAKTCHVKLPATKSKKDSGIILIFNSYKLLI